MIDQVAEHADPGDEDQREAAGAVERASHAGLSDLDPWLDRARAAAPPRPPTAWPFGLDAAAEVLEVAALALFMFIAVRAVAQNFIVDGGSMEPNFHNGELVIVNKLAFRSFDVSWLPWTDEAEWRPFGVPEPGDVVVFQFPQDPARDFIKRVIAIPGQTVMVRNGQVYVDGDAVSEPYLAEPPHYEYGPITVPVGELFVLGDNRNNSYDSHNWGLLSEDLLIGRADLRYWPLSEAGLIGQHDLGTAQAEVSSSR